MKTKERSVIKFIVFKLTIITVFFVTSPIDILAQGYAGPNKTIMTDSSVVIGSGNCPNCCYQWSPATGLSDTKIARPTAKPAVTTTYTLKVKGPNFSFTDVSQVTVTVKDGMDGLTVTPKSCCWKKGDDIKLDQFTIITDPPGMENTVTLSPTSVPGNIFLGLPSANPLATLPVTFTARGSNNTTKTAVVNISCVDQDVQTANSVGVSADQFKAIEDKVKNVISYFNLGVCQASGGPSVNVTYTTGKLCCPEAGCIKDMKSFSGTFNVDAGIECDFPFFGLPYAASANGRITANMQGSLSLGNVRTSCSGVELCYGVGLTGSVGGGVSVTAGAGKIVNSSLMIVGSISPEPIEYCFPSGKLNGLGNVCFKADVVGTVTVFSYWTWSGSISLINQRCIK